MPNDLEARVRVAEEELDLLKNQVQQTLLDVREHILDLVEPTSGLQTADQPAAAGAVAAAPAVATEIVDAAAPAPGGGVAELPATETGAAPLPDLGGDVDMGGGMADMPALDMGGGMGDLAGPDMGGDVGGDAGLEDMGGFDMPGMDPGAGMDGGFDMENAPYDGMEEAPGGPGIADAPYDGAETYSDQGPTAYQDDYPDADGANYEHAADGTPQDPYSDASDEFGDPSAEPAAGETPSAADAPSGGVRPVVEAALAEMDLITLVGVLRWVDQAVQRLGQRRVDALLDVWQMTGRISGATKEMIERLCALTHEDAEERVPLQDLVAMMIQMEAVFDTEESSNSRLLAMLFGGSGDPLSGLEAFAPR